MKKLEFYDFVGVITPGGVSLLALSLVYPHITGILPEAPLSLGEFGLFFVLSYVAGQLTQALGNLIERIFWTCFRGMPTDWVRTGRRELLAAAQRQNILARIEARLNLTPPFQVGNLSAKSWYSITQQIGASVRAADRGKRVDTFNGIYGLCRGIAAAFLIGFILVTLKHGWLSWKSYLGFAAAVAVALFRMYRFGVNYGRELFVQFAQLPD